MGLLTYLGIAVKVCRQFKILKPITNMSFPVKVHVLPLSYGKDFNNLESLF